MDNPVRVLHVDDDADFLALTAAFLEREPGDISVTSVTSASEGLDRLATAEFDCIVSDYDMPEQNGIAFLTAVRDRNPTLPFILFTGKGSEEIASEAISAGVSDYLQKGSGTERYSLLANRIDNLVDKYRAETTLQNRAKQQQFVADLGKTALGGIPLDDLFEQAVAGVSSTLDTDYAKVLEYRPESDDLLLRAGVGWQNGLVGQATVGTGADSQAGHTLRTEEPIVVEDLRDESRFSGPSLLVDHDVASGISVIIGSLEDPWGVLGTHSTEQTTFTDDDISFTQSVANVLATAIRREEHATELKRVTRAMDEAPVGITITDPAQDDNPLIYVNSEFETLTGYDREELLGRNCRLLQGEATDSAPVAAMRAAIDTREPVTVELRNYRKDGTAFWNRVTIAPITDDSGTLQHFVGFQEDISPRKEQENQREAMIEFLEGICTIVADSDSSFDEKVTRLLQIGPETLDLPYGCMTRIESGEAMDDEATQTIFQASGDHDLLQPGASCPLSESYCRKTIEQAGLMEVHDAVAEGWAGDPAFERFDLHSYLGTNVTVGDELYGTVFIASRTPREEPFTDAERTFVRLLGQLISYELEREYGS